MRTDGAPSASSPAQTLKIAPQHFGGPFGAALLTVLMPTISIYLWACIHRNGGGLLLPRSLDDARRMLALVPLPTGRAVLYFGIWLLLQVLLQLVAPGKTVQGMPLRDGSRLSYRVNGWASFWISMGLLVVLLATGVLPRAAIYDELGPLLSTATLFALLLAAFLYFYGYRSPRPEQRSGSPIYDFFLGTSLNPRFGSFDLKMFFESRIGMGSWGALIIAMAAAQYERVGTLSGPMILVSLFQLVYVADFFYFESALLSTWDIMHENYGFMLVHAFLVWIPFNFSLQGQYLASRMTTLPVWATVLISVLFVLGYIIFRTSNLQKHRFRSSPESLIWGKKPTYIKTARGSLLLTSGWWGLARHANYLGDLMMALAMCIPCGFSSVLPHFYFIYFAPLLINRERRDHSACHAKYGADWEAYCQKVPWRIVPRIY